MLNSGSLYLLSLGHILQPVLYIWVIATWSLDSGEFAKGREKIGHMVKSISIPFHGVIQSKTAPSSSSVTAAMPRYFLGVAYTKTFHCPDRFITGRVTSKMTRRKWRSFSSRRRPSGSKTWPATRSTWSASPLSTRPGTAPGAAPRRAGHTRQVRDRCLVSKHRLGDDQYVTGQWLRETGGRRRALVFRFSFRMGHYLVIVSEGKRVIK